MPLADKFSLPTPTAALAQSSTAVASPVDASAATASAGPSTLVTCSDGAGAIWRAAISTGSPEVVEFTLRHMAMIAQRRNAYDLLERVIRACKERGIDLRTVLTPETHLDDDPDASTHPFEILHAVSTAKGYCQARTIRANGNNSFFNNAAFEHDVLSLEACNRAYERNNEQVLALFIHTDDLPTVHAFVASVWRKAACNSGQLVPSDGTARVRVWHRRLRTYMPCTMTASILIRRNTGSVSAAVELVPDDDPPAPPTSPALDGPDASALTTTTDSAALQPAESRAAGWESVQLTAAAGTVTSGGTAQPQPAEGHRKRKAHAVEGQQATSSSAAASSAGAGDDSVEAGSLTLGGLGGLAGGAILASSGGVYPHQDLLGAIDQLDELLSSDASMDAAAEKALEDLLGPALLSGDTS
jgi:hypothetical protein